jgi:hypothetical protein
MLGLGCLVLLGVWVVRLLYWVFFFFAFPVFGSKAADLLLTSDQRTPRVASYNFQVED